MSTVDEVGLVQTSASSSSSSSSLAVPAGSGKRFRSDLLDSSRQSSTSSIFKSSRLSNDTPFYMRAPVFGSMPPLVKSRASRLLSSPLKNTSFSQSSLSTRSEPPKADPKKQETAGLSPAAYIIYSKIEEMSNKLPGSIADSRKSPSKEDKSLPEAVDHRKPYARPPSARRHTTIGARPPTSTFTIPSWLPTKSVTKTSSALSSDKPSFGAFTSTETPLSSGAGKIRTKVTQPSRPVRVAEEEIPKEPELPKIALPISELPKFNLQKFTQKETRNEISKDIEIMKEKPEAPKPQADASFTAIPCKFDEKAQDKTDSPLQTNTSKENIPSSKSPPSIQSSTPSFIISSPNNSTSVSSVNREGEVQAKSQSSASQLFTSNPLPVINNQPLFSAKTNGGLFSKLPEDEKSPPAPLNHQPPLQSSNELPSPLQKNSNLVNSFSFTNNFASANNNDGSFKTEKLNGFKFSSPIKKKEPAGITCDIHSEFLFSDAVLKGASNRKP